MIQPHFLSLPFEFRPQISILGWARQTQIQQLDGVFSLPPRQLTQHQPGQVLAVLHQRQEGPRLGLALVAEPKLRQAELAVQGVQLGRQAGRVAAFAQHRRRDKEVDGRPPAAVPVHVRWADQLCEVAKLSLSQVVIAPDQAGRLQLAAAFGCQGDREEGNLGSHVESQGASFWGVEHEQVFTGGVLAR